MRRVLLTFALLLTLVPLPAARGFFAISVPQDPVTFSANDPVVAFAGAPSGQVCVVGYINSKSQTASITGAPAAVTTVYELMDHSTTAQRHYAWCWQGDGVDNSFTVTTTSTTTARGFAIELSGSGSVDGFSNNETNELAGTPLTLTTDITTSGTGSIMLAFHSSASVSNFTADTGNGFTSVPSDGSDIGTTSLGQYKILGAAGAYDAPFTADAAESGYLSAMAIAASGGAVAPRSLLMLGVGGR